MIIQALPGAGKTWLALVFPDRYVDSDVVVRSMINSHRASDFEAKIMADEVKMALLATQLFTAHHSDKYVLCNFNPNRIGLHVDYRVAYQPLDYVEHLKLADRRDLLALGEDTLYKWARAYRSLPDVVWLKPGQFLSSVIRSR